MLCFCGNHLACTTTTSVDSSTQKSPTRTGPLVRFYCKRTDSGGSSTFQPLGFGFFAGQKSIVTSPFVFREPGLESGSVTEYCSEDEDELTIEVNLSTPQLSPDDGFPAHFVQNRGAMRIGEGGGRKHRLDLKKGEYELKIHPAFSNGLGIDGTDPTNPNAALGKELSLYRFAVAVVTLKNDVKRANGSELETVSTLRIGEFPATEQSEEATSVLAMAPLISATGIDSDRNFPLITHKVTDFGPQFGDDYKTFVKHLKIDREHPDSRYAYQAAPYIPLENLWEPYAPLAGMPILSPNLARTCSNQSTNLTETTPINANTLVLGIFAGTLAFQQEKDVTLAVSTFGEHPLSYLFLKAIIKDL